MKKKCTIQTFNNMLKFKNWEWVHFRILFIDIVSTISSDYISHASLLYSELGEKKKWEDVDECNVALEK